MKRSSFQTLLIFIILFNGLFITLVHRYYQDQMQSLHNDIISLQDNSLPRPILNHLIDNDRLAYQEKKEFLQKINRLQKQLDGKKGILDFSDIVEEVLPSVVSVRTDSGQGSGVIIDPRGYILTNRHVIEQAEKVSIITNTGMRFSVVNGVVSRDLDLALLKIKNDFFFPVLNFSDGSRVGEEVIAVGTPVGLSHSVTKGIISGVGRSIDRSGSRYIQTDVPINPGNSGGPLINKNKEIVGINTLKLRSYEGLGFAITAQDAQAFTRSAIDFLEEEPL